MHRPIIKIHRHPDLLGDSPDFTGGVGVGGEEGVSARTSFRSGVQHALHTGAPFATVGTRLFVPQFGQDRTTSLICGCVWRIFRRAVY